MKKHQVNHPLPVPASLPSRRELRIKPKTSRKVVLGVAAAAVLALSVTPALGARQSAAVPMENTSLQFEEATFNPPVEVGLLDGVDAIRWNSENITSAGVGAQVADASDPEAILGVAGAAGQLVGQNLGPLGVLPAGIQLIHPVSSRRITSPYGWRGNPTGAGTQIHIGQDYAISCGSPVYATADGEVVQSAWAGHSGMRVTLDHGSSVRTGYSHNSKLIAKVGDKVKQGQLIALSGTTGNSTGCHVHFEVIIDGRWNDPRNFLPIIPGQPNPLIDSRRTTVAAGPIRNTGAPQTSNDNGHDINVPEPPKSAPVTKAPVKETTPSPVPPTSTGEPQPETSQTPVPGPTNTLKPDESAEPTPTVHPSSTTHPPKESVPGSESASPTPTAPVKQPSQSVEPKPTETASDAREQSDSSMQTTYGSRDSEAP